MNLMSLLKQIIAMSDDVFFNMLSLVDNYSLLHRGQKMLNTSEVQNNQYKSFSNDKNSEHSP